MLIRLSQPGVRILTVLAVFPIAFCALLADAVNAHPGSEPHSHMHFQEGFAEGEYPSEPSVLPATDLSLSLLSFAVGVAACLLVVRAVLPTLVRAHCAEIVRDYMDRSMPDTGVQVVVIDRDRAAREQVAAAPTVRTTVAGRHVRVDAASAAPAPSQVTSAAPAPSQVTPTPGNVETQSILGRVYEQNVQLRDQLRLQAERNQP